MIISTANKDKLISHIRSECKKNKVKILIRPGKYIMCDGIKTSGYFDSKKREMVCARQNPNFLLVLAHEFCHMTQWIDSKVGKCKMWVDYDNNDVEVIDKWLLNKKKHYHRNKLKAMVKTCLNLELDNEKRTYKLLKKFGMNKEGLDLYVQKSNAYVLFYLYLLETRSWYKPGNAPYENKDVVGSMSTKFNMKYDKLSSRIKKIYKSNAI
jgi:ssDNA-binding Zn-finger/Zn-ribbon topoisomerase 1